jgi:hypothetical protein
VCAAAAAPAALGPLHLGQSACVKGMCAAAPALCKDKEAKLCMHSSAAEQPARIACGDTVSLHHGTLQLLGWLCQHEPCMAA